MVMSDERKLPNFTQEPDSKKLSLFLHRNYQGAHFKCAYKAGFNAQRELISTGIDGMVIHPADIPATDKEKRQKNDQLTAEN